MFDTSNKYLLNASQGDNRSLDVQIIRLDREHELGLEVLCLADVTLKPIDWMWPNWLARGKVHVLASERGGGKSIILCDIASRTTRGESWPDGSCSETLRLTVANGKRRSLLAFEDFRSGPPRAARSWRPNDPKLSLPKFERVVPEYIGCPGIWKLP